MAVRFELSDQMTEDLMDKLSLLQEEGEQVVNEVFHGDGAELIKVGITKKLPVSGRTWKGKGKPAREGKPFRQINSNLAVTVLTTKKYNYLYFPDDGSNTVRHEGGQHFMLRGTESQAGNIVDICLDKLVKAIEG